MPKVSVRDIEIHCQEQGSGFPFILIHGLKGKIFTPIHLAEQIHYSIGGSEWKILEGVGHNLYIEKARQLAEVVLEFLTRQQGVIPLTFAGDRDRVQG